MSTRIDDATAVECAKVLRDWCQDRGCKDCPINCRWDDDGVRFPTRIPAEWRIKEVSDAIIQK